MRILFWFSVLMGSVQAFACADLLRSQLPQIHGKELRFEGSARRDLRMMNLSEEKLKRFTDANIVFALQDEGDSLHTIVFEPNPAKADRGVVLTGYKSGKDYVITRAEWAHRDDEMDYFRAVARQHNLERVQVSLKRNILNCPMLFVDGWVQTKLWLKHRLDLAAVAKFINFTRAIPTVDHTHNSKGRAPRYVINGFDEFKREMLAVIGGEGNCPNVLITAFEVK